MRRVLLAIVLLIAVSARGAGLVGSAASGGGAAAAIKPQWWVGSIDSGIPSSAMTRYLNPMAPENGDATTDIPEAARCAPMPTAGAVSDLTVTLSGDVGTLGDDLIWTLRKAGADTALTCTITGADVGTQSTCTLAATPITYAAGETACLKLVSVGTPSSAEVPRWRMKFTPTVADRFVVLATNTGASTTAVRYFTQHGVSTGNGTISSMVHVWPLAASITAIYVSSDGTYTGTMARTFALMKNGSPEADVTCAVNSGGATCNDAGTVAIAAGDLVEIRDTPTAGGDAEPLDNRGIGILFDPTTEGEFPLMAQSGSSPSAAADRFSQLSGGVITWNATEAFQIAYMPALTVKRLYANYVTAPGASASWAWTLRIAGADSAMTCTSADPATTCCADVSGAGGCTDVADVAITDGQTAAFESDPSATAPAGTGRNSLSLAVVSP